MCPRPLRASHRLAPDWWRSRLGREWSLPGHRSIGTSRWRGFPRRRRPAPAFPRSRRPGRCRPGRRGGHRARPMEAGSGERQRKALHWAAARRSSRSSTFQTVWRRTRWKSARCGLMESLPPSRADPPGQGPPAGTGPCVSWRRWCPGPLPGGVPPAPGSGPPHRPPRCSWPRCGTG